MGGVALSLEKLWQQRESTGEVHRLEVDDGDVLQTRSEGVVPCHKAGPRPVQQQGMWLY